MTDPSGGHPADGAQSAGRSSRRLAERGLGLLYLGPLITYGDRFAIPPILLAISRELQESLTAVAAVPTSYYLCYGVMQPVFGMLSDRIGRVRVMRLALAGMGAANVLAATAPTLVLVVVGKAVTAAFAAAVLPTSLVYVGDKVDFDRRQRVIANVLAGGAVGTVVATVGAGLLASFASWRLAFVIPGVIALVLAVVYRWLPESFSAQRGAGPLTQARRVFAQRWSVFVVGLAVAEGAVMLGFLTYLAPALEAQGRTAAVAGGVVAAYGVAVFVGLQAVKRVVRKTGVTPAQLIGVGGLMLLLAYVSAAQGQEVANILSASVLLGLAFAFLHSTLQTWATEVAPHARGTATSFFVTAVFTGAAIGTGAVSGIADAGRFGLLFGIAAVLTVPVVIVAFLARARFHPLTDSA